MIRGDGGAGGDLKCTKSHNVARIMCLYFINCEYTEMCMCVCLCVVCMHLRITVGGLTIFKCIGF